VPHFPGVERLGQNVISAQIQRLSPQALVGQPRSDDQARWVLKTMALGQHGPPGILIAVAVAQQDGHVSPAELRQRGFDAGTSL